MTVSANNDMAWHGMARHGTARHGLAWPDTTIYYTIKLISNKYYTMITITINITVILVVTTSSA